MSVTACLSWPRSSAPGSWRATTTARSWRWPPTATVDWSVGEVDAPVLPALVQQADPGAGDGASSASTCRRTCSRWPAPPTPASRSTSRAYAASWPSAGLDESALQTPPDYPLDDDAREAVIRDGGAKTSILMNCSGKHAAMLATCVAQGLGHRRPTSTPQHPLQVAIAETFARLTGEPVERRRRRRLRRAAAVHLADRPGARLRARSRPRPTGRRAPGRRGDPPAPGVRQRHHARRAARCSARSPG